MKSERGAVLVMVAGGVVLFLLVLRLVSIAWPAVDAPQPLL